MWKILLEYYDKYRRKLNYFFPSDHEKPISWKKNAAVRTAQSHSPGSSLTRSRRPPAGCGSWPRGCSEPPHADTYPPPGNIHRIINTSHRVFFSPGNLKLPWASTLLIIEDLCLNISGVSAAATAKSQPTASTCGCVARYHRPPPPPLPARKRTSFEVQMRLVLDSEADSSARRRPRDASSFSKSILHEAPGIKVRRDDGGDELAKNKGEGAELQSARISRAQQVFWCLPEECCCLLQRPEARREGGRERRAFQAALYRTQKR